MESFHVSLQELDKFNKFALGPFQCISIIALVRPSSKVGQLCLHFGIQSFQDSKSLEF